MLTPRCFHNKHTWMFVLSAAVPHCSLLLNSLYVFFFYVFCKASTSFSSSSSLHSVSFSLCGHECASGVCASHLVSSHLLPTHIRCPSTASGVYVHLRQLFSSMRQSHLASLYSNYTGKGLAAENMDTMAHSDYGTHVQHPESSLYWMSPRPATLCSPVSHLYDALSC